MEMHQIRYFLSVAKTLNFTQAADECHVAQPSLSRAILKLEEELGGDLFRRERGLTHLTDLGRMMLPLLTQCLESAMAAKQLAVSYKKGTCAPLCFALSHTINLQLLIQPLTELVKAFPGLELKFSRGNAEDVGERLKKGEADLGIACPLKEPWDRLEFLGAVYRAVRARGTEDAPPGDAQFAAVVSVGRYTPVAAGVLRAVGGVDGHLVCKWPVPGFPGPHRQRSRPAGAACRQRRREFVAAKLNDVGEFAACSGAGPGVDTPRRAVRGLRPPALPGRHGVASAAAGGQLAGNPWPS